MNSLLESDPSALRDLLWGTVERAVLIGDLYAPISGEAHDLALDCGWELSAWAERLEEERIEERDLRESRLALERAQAQLAQLAPLG